MDLQKTFLNTISTDNTLRNQGNSYITLAEQTLNSITLDFAILEQLFTYITSTERLELKQCAALFLKSYITNYWVKII
jgi:hypothetical protein